MHIIIFFVILILLVIIHELGHFIAAKKNGVLVEEFGVGFPPRLFGVKIGETLYSVNLIPLGGFVKLFGEEYHELPRKKQEGLNHRAFVNKKPWQKAIIIVAGVLMHFLLGWVLISYLFTQGVPTPTNKVRVEKVVAESPAAKAGLKGNDLISSLVYQGKEYKIISPEDLRRLSQRFAGDAIILVVEENGRQKKVTVTPRKVTKPNEGALGVVISPSFTVKKYPWYSAPFYGLKEAAYITYRVVGELGKTVVNFVSSQKAPVEITGPIGIVRYTKDAAQSGMNALLELMALLALNLAVINILPFPALDGGRLIFIIYEWITGKRINSTFERYLNLVGFVLLLILALVITFRDIITFYL